jgi:hypothetical protein
MNRILLVLLAAAAIGAGNWALQRPIVRSAGVSIDGDPRQSEASDTAVMRHGEFELTPLAGFEVRARVLSRADYSIGAESALSPTDLALGWGRMSDTAVIEQLDISQSGRFYFYRWRDSPPIPPDEIVRSSANMHLIPANDAVADALDQVREGSIVTFRGQLVRADRADGWHWTSSLTREDSGAGACELVLVQAIESR